MDSSFVYWTAALINMAALTAFAFRGVRQVRRGEVARHRRSMTISAGLVVAFVMSYIFKLALLGREDLSIWSATAVGILRVHELCVLTMVITGAIALRLGGSLRHTRIVSRDDEDPEPSAGMLARHRRAGRVALAATLLGFALAIVVLWGMWGRLFL